MGTIIIPYKPRFWSKELHNTDKKLIVIVAHRRSGKTTATLNHLIREAIRNPRSIYAYIAPTYKQAKMIAWDYLQHYIKEVPSKINQSELNITFPNGSKIMLLGSDNPDSLRGIGLWGVVFDEYAQQPSNIYSEIVSKSLADHNGFAIWIGTPKGKGDFYRLHKIAEKEDDYLSIYFTIDQSLDKETGDTIDNLRLALESEKKQVARGIMTQDEFDQEWYCSWESAMKGAVYKEQLRKAREEGRITTVRYDEQYPVITAWDLGWNDATAIGFFQQIGNEDRIIDYLEVSGASLSQIVSQLREKGYNYVKHILPHDVMVSDISTGKTRHEILGSLGLSNIEVAPKSSIDDGIQAVRTRFNRFVIDSEKCSILVDKLGLYHFEWDDKINDFKKTPTHDNTSHCADMIRYYCIQPEQDKVVFDYELPNTDW